MFDPLSPQKKFKIFLLSLILTSLIIFFIVFLFSALFSKSENDSNLSSPNINKSIPTENKTTDNIKKVKEVKKVTKTIETKKEVIKKPAQTKMKYYSLNIKTSPSNAKIRIMNIRPKYTQGIKLESGKYHVNISKKGYYTVDKWVEITDGNLNITETLKKKKKTAEVSIDKLFKDI